MLNASYDHCILAWFNQIQDGFHVLWPEHLWHALSSFLQFSAWKLVKEILVYINFFVCKLMKQFFAIPHSF